MNYFIPEANLPEFEKRMSRLIKRAHRLNAILDYEVNRSVFEDRKFDLRDRNDQPIEKWVRFIQVTVEGDRPQLPGWSFIGTLEHTEEGNILRMVPGETAPEKYRDQAPFCEHCKLKRTRKDTYLVKHESGSVTQVGSSCLVDFLGHENPHQLAQLSTVWISIEDLADLAQKPGWLGKYCGGLSYDRHDLMQFLSYVAELVIRYGFLSRAAVNKMIEKHGPDWNAPETTGQRAARFMTGSSRETREEATKHAPTEEAVAMAEAAREWALREFGMAVPEGADLDSIKSYLLGASGRELSDFEHNLFVVAKGESVEFRTFGIAAYLIQAYRKANNLIPARQAPAVKSVHVGTVGQRFMKIKVTCEKVHFWESQEFGQGCLQKMRNADGNILIWKTYNVADENLMEEGKEFTISATVKRHGDFNGELQTEVSRLKVVRPKEEVPPTPPPPIITSLTQTGAPQPENLEPGDNWVPTGLQLAMA